MADWYFAAFKTWQAGNWTPDGMTPQTAWYRGTNQNGASAVDLAQLGEGDTIWILDNHDSGTTDGFLQGTPPTGLTVRGDYPGRPGTLQVLGFNTTSDITISNLRVTGGSLGFTNVDGLLLDRVVSHHQSKGFISVQESNLDNVTIRNCTFHDLTHEGIEVFVREGYTRANWLIENNHIYNVGLELGIDGGADSEGIGLQRLTNSIVRGNHIHHCGYGINLWESGSGVTDGVSITNNRVHHCLGGTVAWPSRGIMISGGSTTEGSLLNIAIEDNEVYKIGRDGIRLQAPPNAQGLTCRGNSIADVNRELGTPNTQYITTATGWLVENNETKPHRTTAHIYTRRR